MNDQLLPFGTDAYVFISLYLLSLLVIGGFGYRASKESSLKDFYLAGNGIGFVVLLLTLYSTQYSGNTLLGFTGKTYRTGFSWVMSVHFMTAIVVVYLFFAPKLHQLAKARSYITPVDFLADRYQHHGLNIVATLLMVLGISNFLLGQLMAMGLVLKGLAPNDPATKQQAFTLGVIVLALIIVVYESLGGLRAVVWTDVIQGSVLMVGFVVLVIMVWMNYGSLSESTAVILASEQHRSKAMLPDANTCRSWFSYIVIVGLGGALYPQSIQRIYAAKSAKTLRRSLQVMAVLPLSTALVAVVVGITGIARFPELAGNGDTILSVICREIQEQSVFGYWLVVVLFSAILAAIMSTADSVLLSISSMLTKDIYGRYLRPSATDKHLTTFGKMCSWVLVAFLTTVAIMLPEDTTLIQLLDIKFDLLVQLAPAFLIGIHRPLSARSVFYGLLCGVATAIGIQFVCAGGKPYGIHAGLYGLVVNLLICWSMNACIPRQRHPS
ncbi:MAG: sodium:solute symporter family protein [Pirellulaceae bacterium]